MNKSLESEDFEIEDLEDDFYVEMPERVPKLSEETKHKNTLFCERYDRKLSADHVHRATFDVDSGLVHYLCFRCLRGILNFISPEFKT